MNASPPRARWWLLYLALVLATVAAFLLIRSWGEALTAASSGAALAVPATTSPTATADPLFRLLVALAAVIALGQLLGHLFARLGQPPVIGEIVAGILLGPSLLGERLSGLVLPASIAPGLGLVAQLGIVLYMFLVGVEMDLGSLAGKARRTVAVSHASILTPFLLGSAVALPLYTRFAPSGVPFTTFALFMGVAMSITAFPVLARILTDWKLTRTDLGVAALSCAAVDDVTAWCLLAVVIGFARAQLGSALWVILGTLAFVAFLFRVVRPAIRKLSARWDRGAPPAAGGLVWVALLASALLAEGIGIHAVFGAFLLGALIPRDSVLVRGFRDSLTRVVTALLLPAFFAYTGMRTRVDLMSGMGPWLWCGVIVVAATAGKLGGTYVAARATGFGARDAGALGALMNTRGLMELVVLHVGLDLGVISPTLFSMMVLMALATTMAAFPLLKWFVGARRLRELRVAAG